MSEDPKPFKVRTDQGVLVASFDSCMQAEASAAERNERAEAMGITTRYVSVSE